MESDNEKFYQDIICMIIPGIPELRGRLEVKRFVRNKIHEIAKDYNFDFVNVMFVPISINKDVALQWICVDLTQTQETGGQRMWTQKFEFVESMSLVDGIRNISFRIAPYDENKRYFS